MYYYLLFVMSCIVSGMLGWSMASRRHYLFMFRGWRELEYLVRTGVKLNIDHYSRAFSIQRYNAVKVWTTHRSHVGIEPRQSPLGSPVDESA